MEQEFSNTEVHKSKGGIYIIIGGLFVVLLAAGIWFIYAQDEKHKEILAERELELEQKNQEIADLIINTTKIEDENKVLSSKLEELEKESCKGNWISSEGCVPYKQTLLFPEGGEKFCFGDTVTIKWNPELVPGDVVEILFTQPRSLFLLDSTPTKKGEYTWKVSTLQQRPDGNPIPIKPDDTYKIKIQSGGKIMENDTSGPFEIANCN